jgi:hypothetical protein
LSILVARIQCGQLDCHPERHVRLSFVQLADTINQLCKGLHKLVENASAGAQVQGYSQRYVYYEPQLLFDLAESGVRFAESFLALPKATRTRTVMWEDIFPCEHGFSVALSL